LSLPTVSRRKTGANGDEPATLETDTSVDFTKRITPDFGIGLGATYVSQKPTAATRSTASTISPRTSSTSSTRATSTKSSSRRRRLGHRKNGREAHRRRIVQHADAGDLRRQGLRRPPRQPALPEAVRSHRQRRGRDADEIEHDRGRGRRDRDDDKESNMLTVGFALQYSVLYLQSFVKDVGLSEPFNRLIPLVEVSLQKPLDGSGPTTGR